jgi:hypothetical protein
MRQGCQIVLSIEFLKNTNSAARFAWAAFLYLRRGPCAGWRGEQIALAFARLTIPTNLKAALVRAVGGFPLSAA